MRNVQFSSFSLHGTQWAYACMHAQHCQWIRYCTVATACNFNAHATVTEMSC